MEHNGHVLPLRDADALVVEGGAVGGLGVGAGVGGDLAHLAALVADLAGGDGAVGRRVVAGNLGGALGGVLLVLGSAVALEGWVVVAGGRQAHGVAAVGNDAGRAGTSLEGLGVDVPVEQAPGADRGRDLAEGDGPLRDAVAVLGHGDGALDEIGVDGGGEGLGVVEEGAGAEGALARDKGHEAGEPTLMSTEGLSLQHSSTAA